MKRLLVTAAALVAAIGFIAPAQASVAKGTIEGPYGPVAFQDYGTCTNIWADINQKTTYKVGKPDGDGVYHMSFVLAGPFTAIAGQSPGACDKGVDQDNGNLVKKGIKGKMTQTFYMDVVGGKFNPKAKCDDACATTYDFIGVNEFVNTFFKGSPTWAFSTTKLTHQVATSTDSRLCANKWTVDYDPASGTITKATGDIATTCK